MSFSRRPSPRTCAAANPPPAPSTPPQRPPTPATPKPSPGVIAMAANDDNTLRSDSPPQSPGQPVAPPPRPTAVLDSAHLGDIEGAFGRISVADTDRPRTLKTRLLTLAAIGGPRIIR